MKKFKYTLWGMIVVFILLIIYNLAYTFVEPKAYDFMTKNVLTEKFPFDTHKNVYGHDDVVVVVIDEKTLEKYRWPWKREVNCKIFEYFSEYAKPKALMYDMLIVSLDEDNPESDKKFFKSLSKFDNLSVAFMPLIKNYDDKSLGETYDKSFISKYSVNAENRTETKGIFRSLMIFPEPYKKAIKHAGSVAMFQGFIDGELSGSSRDDVYRNQQYFSVYKGNIVPSLSMAGFLAVNNNPKVILNKDSIEFPDLNYKIKQNSNKYQMSVPLRYYDIYPIDSPNSGYSHQKYSAVQIMNSYDAIIKGNKPEIDPSIFKDKIVLIGANVPGGEGMNDNKNTPITSSHPGVDYQATAADNLFHNDFLKVLPNFVNILLTIIGMFAVYVIIRLNELVKSITLTIALIFGYIVFSAVCFYFCVIVNVITPPVMFIITMIIAFTHKFILESRSKEKVKNAMGKYMSEDVMKRVIQNIDNLGLGGKRATVTVLFADIRGFTSMSERMTAQQVSEILNEYFTEIEPIITKYNGIINKFIGDAVMAIFGEPIQDKNHPENAVRCGYEMLLKVKELQNKWVAEGKPKIEIGVGVNTGEVFVGNIGSVNRMEYTVIGDTVNLASRLESYNKIYKTKMLISPSTYNETKGILDTIKISDVEIRGKANKINIYEVLRVIDTDAV